MTYKKIIDSDKYKQLKLQQQKDTISKMIITLSHEINNPLAIVKMCLTRLENERSQDLIERCDKNLERIIEINRLIKDLQDFDEVKYGETTTMYDIFKRIEIDRNGKFKRLEDDLLN
ncbi:histidine kinase dimerization/phospho-acceptor domain-containing protein [Halobacteriovorax sp. YZS-1-1]